MRPVDEVWGSLVAYLLPVCWCTVSLTSIGFKIRRIVRLANSLPGCKGLRLDQSRTANQEQQQVAPCRDSWEVPPIVIASYANAPSAFTWQKELMSSPCGWVGGWCGGEGALLLSPTSSRLPHALCKLSQRRIKKNV